MGSGFGLQGLSAIKNNRKLLKKKSRSLSLTADKKTFVDPKTATPKLLEEIRYKMKLQQQQNKRRLVIAWVVVLGILVGGILLITKN